MIQNQKTSAKPDKNKELIVNAKKFEDAKEYNTLKFAEALFNIRKNNAQIAAGYNDDMDGFKDFCGKYLNTRYHTAMRYIAIHKMVVNLNVDPAVAEDLGYSKLRTIASIANVDNIGLCLEKAQELTTSDLEEWVKEYKNGKNPDASDDSTPMMKKFIFPASAEEVPILESTLRDVHALLNNNNNTTALVHICQSYMEFAYPHERKQAIETMKKESVDKEKAQEALKDKVVDPKLDKKQDKKPEKKTTEVRESGTPHIISESEIPKAALHDLLAFAEANDIVIDPKKASSKSAVKAYIIDVLTERALADDSEDADLPENPEVVEEAVPEVLQEVPVVEETMEETPEEAPPVEKPKKGRKAKTEEASVSGETQDASKKDNKKPKADKADKAPKAVKEETPVEVLPDPAAAVDEEKEITFEDAINEVRNVIDKKHLVEVATSYGITLSEDMIASHDAEFLIEEVVKTLCTENSHEYIPPKDDDTSDLDAMIAGE